MRSAIYDDKFHLFTNCCCHPDSDTSSGLATFPNDNSKLLLKLNGGGHKYEKRREKRRIFKEKKFDGKQITETKKVKKVDGRRRIEEKIKLEKRRDGKRRFEEKIRIQKRIDDNSNILTDLQKELEYIYKNFHKVEYKDINLSLNASLTWTVLATTFLYVILVRTK